MQLSKSISAHGQAPFMVYGGVAFTYGDLEREMGRVGEILAAHAVGPGEVVAMTGTYDFSAGVWFLALAAWKAIVVPLVGGDPHEVAARMGESGAAWVVKDGKLSPCQPPPGQRLEDGLRAKLGARAGLILFSSGSTGRAKGMLHDLDTLIDSYPVGRRSGLRVLAFMGIDHVGGIDMFLRGIASGACLVVPRERSPEAVCRLIEEARVDVLPTTPSFLNLILLSGAHRGRDLASLKIIGFGAERMAPAVLERLRKVFPQVCFQQKFGTSETNAVRTVTKTSDPLWMRIDDDGVDWKIVDQELWLKTPSRILGYLNYESDRLAADGWYRTGDLVEEDGGGFFRIVGRRESMINVGGEKVVPGEVEVVIAELGAVRDCRVFGQENPLVGQVVMAEIVLAEGVEEKEAVRAVRKHCRERLAPFKVPVRIRPVAEIGMTERFKRKL